MTLGALDSTLVRPTLDQHGPVGGGAVHFNANAGRHGDSGWFQDLAELGAEQVEDHPLGARCSIELPGGARWSGGANGVRRHRMRTRHGVRRRACGSCSYITRWRDQFIDDLVVRADVPADQPRAVQATADLVHLLARVNVRPGGQLIIIQRLRAQPQCRQHLVSMRGNGHANSLPGQTPRWRTKHAPTRTAAEACLEGVPSADSRHGAGPASRWWTL